jgi:hypothetical protein
MGNHQSNLVVVLFWCATMTWLVVAKIVPPLRVGEPPSYAKILQQSGDEPPVGWQIQFDNRTIGWAANKLVRRKDGITDLYSRVYLGKLPWDELAPGLLGSVLKPVLVNLGPMDVDKKTRLVIDPLGRLVEFESRVRMGSLADVVKVQGQIEGAKLKLSAQSGELPYKVEQSLPPNALMNEELSPQVRMPGLRVGQAWTVPLYSPFRAPNSPVEVLQAVVERQERLTWGGKSVPCHVVVYRADSGATAAAADPRGRMWVDPEGFVLRQEITIMGSHLHFVRLGSKVAEDVCTALGHDWFGELPSHVARGLLVQIVTAGL